MVRRKIFIGISLPKEAKKVLVRKIGEWEEQELPIKWISENNFHITLSFLGYVDDDMVMEICDQVKKAVSEIEIFDINLSKIELGPEPGKDARVVWVSGEVSDKLRELQEEIERGMGTFQREKKAFRPHITLGRIRKRRWQELEETPEIDEPFSVSMSVESVEIFESVEIRGKREFLVIESCPLY